LEDWGCEFRVRRDIRFEVNISEYEAKIYLLQCV
jgi:hypothetical protein